MDTEVNTTHYERYTLEYAGKTWSFLRWNRTYGQERFSLTGYCTLNLVDVFTQDFRHIVRFLPYTKVQIYAPKKVIDVTTKHFETTNTRKMLVASGQGYRVQGESTLFRWEDELQEDTYKQHMWKIFTYGPKLSELESEIGNLQKYIDENPNEDHQNELMQLRGLEELAHTAEEAEKMALKEGWNR